MKKLIFLLANLIFVFQAMADGFFYSYEGQMLKYQIISEDEKTVMVGDFNHVSGDIVIPSIAEDDNGSKYSVVKIGNDAFYGQIDMISVMIPESVTEIGDCSFIFCENLTSVSMGNSMIKIGDQAFSRCRSLTSLTIPNTVVSIGDFAFGYCDSLSSMFIPNSCTSIGAGAFIDCKSLKSMHIPSSVTHIGEKTFWNCDNLTEITVQNENQYFHSIDGVMFNNDDSILLFYPSGKSTDYIIPDSVIEIGDYAFCGSVYLMFVTIPDSVIKIGYKAFSECKNLILVKFGCSIAEICAEAFLGCDSLGSVYLPASVTQIGLCAFSYCWWLQDITIEEENPYYQSIDGVLFNKDCTMICFYPSGKFGDYIIPDSVIEIGEYAFHTCEGLTSVKLSDSIKSIGRGAFSRSGLTSVVLPDNITDIKDAAFNSCNNLRDIVLGKSIQSIGEWVFTYGIERIESKSIVPPSAYPNTFTSEMYSTTVIDVPEISLDDYRKDSVWGLFHNIKACGVETIVIDYQTSMSIYSISGECLYNGIYSEIENKLCPGVYIIRQGNVSRKFIKK